MLQVIRVGLYSGKYVFLNKDGRELDPNVESTIISKEDADVLMERIRQGYQYVPGGHYILRLEMSGPQYDTAYFEFTEMVLFRTDDDGYPIPCPFTLISQDQYDHPAMVHSSVDTAVAVIDYEQQIVKWMGNPLADDPYVDSPIAAVKCCEADPDAGQLMLLATRYLMREQPVHVSAINVRFHRRS